MKRICKVGVIIVIALLVIIAKNLSESGTTEPTDKGWEESSYSPLMQDRVE